MIGAIIMAAALAGGGPLAAGDGGEALSNIEAQKDLAEFADCVVSKKSNREDVNAFLRVVPNSEHFYPASMKAADFKCLDAAAVRRHASKLQMKLQPGTFRTALYPALYRREFGNARTPMIAAVPPLDPVTEYDAVDGALPVYYLTERAFGDCVARAAPAGVHALLLSRPYSKEAAAAIAQIKPALPGCLPAKTTVHLSRDALRADTGEAMYKLAIAAKSAPSTGSKQ